MRKFKCVDNSYYYITPGKVYDVIEYIKRDMYSDVIHILNDNDEMRNYVLYSPLGRKIFHEVTTEYRDKTIDEILS